MTKPFDPNAELFNIEVKVPDPDHAGEYKWIVLFDSQIKEDAEKLEAFMKRSQPAPDCVRTVPRFHPG